MCGRFGFNATKQLIEAFLGAEFMAEFLPRFNIAPMQDIWALRLTEQGQRQLALLRWGLVPAWAKDDTLAAKMINARSETVADKPAFRSALKHRRCIVPASGFYEWKKQGKQKLPHYFKPKDGGLLAFAGLWERWTAPTGQPLETCTILTTEANALVKPLHDRMPVVLQRDALGAWLAQDTPAASLQGMLQPCPPESLEAQPVGAYVNHVRNEGPACLEPPACEPSLF